MRRTGLLFLACAVSLFLLTGCGLGGGKGGGGGPSIYLTATIKKGSTVVKSFSANAVKASLGVDVVWIAGGVTGDVALGIGFLRPSSVPATLTIGDLYQGDEALATIMFSSGEEFDSDQPGGGGVLKITTLTGDRVAGEFTFKAATSYGSVLTADGKFNIPAGEWYYYNGSWHGSTTTGLSKENKTDIKQEIKKFVDKM